MRNNKLLKLLPILLVIIGGFLTGVYYRYFATIIDIPRFMQMPYDQLVNVCDIVDISCYATGTSVTFTQPTLWTRITFTQPMEYDVHYDGHGNAHSFVVGPHTLWRYRLRFSNGHKWITRFGLSPRIPPTDIVPSIEWKDLDGYRVIIESSSLDVGGDDDDAIFIVRNMDKFNDIRRLHQQSR